MDINIPPRNARSHNYNYYIITSEASYLVRSMALDLAIIYIYNIFQVDRHSVNVKKNFYMYLNIHPI